MKNPERRLGLADMKNVLVYTDGACLGNPGPGGYGVVMLFGPHRQELSAGFRKTTNNRMELLAPIRALEALNQPCRVVLYSDSKYVVDGMQKGWARKWRANRWMRNRKDPAINPDLWGRLLDLCERHQVQFRWVKGHSGDVENERCDHLASGCAREPTLVDEEFERQNPS